MLLQFSVENYKSFRNKVVFSMEASADKELPGNIVVKGKEKYLKVAALFGANAAGKSNLFQALTAGIMTIRQSNTRQVNEPLHQIIPFRFNEQSQTEPTKFEFVFIGQDGKKYVYGFAATRKEVVREYLYMYRTNKPSTVYEREGEQYRFTSSAAKREMLPLTARNTANKLFLATATLWNCEKTKIPYIWFETGINTFSTDFEQLIRQTAPMFESDEDQSLKQFTTNLLHEADINIDDFEFRSKELTKEQFLQTIPQEMRGLVSTVPLENNKQLEINTVHTVEDQEQTRRFGLSLFEESKGTQNLFLLSPFLKRAFETGETLCIDEFDASIHPMLIVYLIGLFNNPGINKENAQLILSTHAVSIMSLKNLRRDQIYFVEKDRRTGVSEIYSLDEFSPRKQEDIRKAYLLGRFGAVPEIPEEAGLWQ